MNNIFLPSKDPGELDKIPKKQLTMEYRIGDLIIRVSETNFTFIAKTQIDGKTYTAQSSNRTCAIGKLVILISE
jgi:hypothetical protein